MKNQVIVKFSSANYNPKWEVQLNIDRLRRKLKNNIVKTINGNYYYKFDLYDSLYEEVVKLKKKYSEDIYMTTVFEPVYSDEELEQAVAFIPRFQKIQLEEYGDDNLTHNQICDECGISRLKEKLIANPDGKSKILKSSAKVIKCGEQIDELYGISKYMFEQIDDVELKESFKPIFAKKAKEPFGYAFFSTKTIDLYNNNFVYEKCARCGETYAEEKRFVEKYEDYYFVENPIFEGSEVLFSSQYYYGNQLCVISPKLYKWIVSEVKDAMFIPVFVKG